LNFFEAIDFISIPYDPKTRQAIKDCFGLRDHDQKIILAESYLHHAHVDVATQLMQAHSDLSIDYIGFHGQTITHDPAMGFTFQIGDAQALADHFHVPVIHQFRQADVQNGGQGAPLIPLFHQMLSQSVTGTKAILNIGGVANMTWIGDAQDANQVVAFDTGTGNALMNDWVKSHYADLEYDPEGQFAAKGNVHSAILENYLSHDYFQKPAPKSLDRNMWDLTPLVGMDFYDGVATLNAFTAHSIRKGLDICPVMPDHIYVCGGGVHNQTLINLLRQLCDCPIESVDVLGIDPNAIEAQGFAWMAARFLQKSPLSMPKTTGCHSPTIAGLCVLPAVEVEKVQIC
jgi:anhydro-N-acetylmuramic acid kinase